MSEFRRKIDRMVDGELDRADERRLLLDCEAGHRWRELALAYVEARAFDQESNALFCEPVQEPASHSVSSPPRLDAGTESWNVWSLAAAVLLSLGLGYGLGWGWQATNSADPSVAANPHPTANHVASRTVKLQDDYTLPSTMQFMVNHPASREMQQVEIPLLNATQLGHDWQQRLQANEWAPVIDKMRRQGLNLRQERTITPVRLSNGQRVVVPVDYFFEQPFQ